MEASFNKFFYYGKNQFFFDSVVSTQFSLALLNVNLLNCIIVSLFKKHNRHKVVFKFLSNIIGINYNNISCLRGLRIRVSGKLYGKSRKRKRVLSWGIMPLQTFSNDIDYSYKVAVTKYGAFGIKVWVFKDRKNLLS